MRCCVYLVFGERFKGRCRILRDSSVGVLRLYVALGSLESKIANVLK